MQEHPMPILSVTDLRKTYGAKTAVDGVTFAVDEGEIVGLLGPNGAGKTTTITMILGMLAPDGGAISIDGIDVRTERRRAAERTNFAAIYAPLPGNLTVRQNLRVFGKFYAVPRLEERIETLLDQFDLLKFADTRSGLLSSGEHTRACVAKAMLNRPRLLLLDEPTASLDPATARDVRACVKRYVETTPTCVLWTSHNMQEVTDVCDRVLFMARGRIVLAGDPATLPAEHGAANLEDLFIRIAREPAQTEAA